MGSPRVWLAGLGVVVVWASAFPAIRVAAPGLGVVGLAFVRLAVAALALLAMAAMTRVRVPARRDVPLVAGCGFLGMTAYQLLLGWGELDVPAGTASMIVAAAPLVSTGVAVLVLGERLTATKVLGSLVAIVGVVTVCLARAGLNLSAAVWIVVAATVVQGLYHPLTKPLLARYTGFEVATYTMVAGTVLVLPLVPRALASMRVADGRSWWAAIYLGLVPSAVGCIWWGFVVARLPVSSSTSLLYLVPAVAVVIAYLWLGELPHAGELLGGLVAIVGVVLVTQGDRLVDRVRARRLPLRV